MYSVYTVQDQNRKTSEKRGGGPLEEEEEKPKAKINFIIVIFEDEMDKMTGIFVCSARFQIYGKGFPCPVIMLS